MPKCHKIYPKCIWHVLPKWNGLIFNSALPTKVYWIYATHIVRVCVSSKFPISPNLPFTEKSNLQVKIGPKSMASPNEILCHHSHKCFDPLLEELLS